MTITTGIGLISGIDTATLIDQLLALESRPKLNLQARLVNLQSQQSAFLDINARLLNLKSSAASLRTANIFQSILATSSNTDVLNATPIIGAGALPGTFSFLVKQLVSTSQKMTGGFTDTTSTPIGLTQLSFEMGQGFVGTDTALADLNGGLGVSRGKIQIDDSAGNNVVIDLTTATTIGEVLDAINSNTTLEATATVEGGHLVITDDNAPAAGLIEIKEVGAGTTAADLGILDSDAFGVITGSEIRTLGDVTPLSSLNDGTGVLIRDANPDIKVTIHEDVRFFDIDFGRIDEPITDSTLIEDLNDGQGIRTNPDSEEDIKFIDRDGNEHLVDLTGIVTVADLRARVEDQTGTNINITIHGDGDKLIVNDTTGGLGLLKVQGAGPLDTQTAEDLGILKEDGVADDEFDGTVLPNADHTPAATTLKQIVDRINNAEDDLGDPNMGRLVASIAADGFRLELVDTTGGGDEFKVESTFGNPTAARDLGIEKNVGVGGSTITGNRLIAGLNSVLVRSLNGGSGLGEPPDLTLDITDRNGDFRSFTLDEDASLGDIIDQINDDTDSVDITASINATGNGLLITDNIGGVSNLIVTGNAAAKLQIDTGALGVDADTVQGGDLELRYIAEATPLSDLNYGRGIGLGSFRITDGDGNQITISIGSDSKNVYDIISEINGTAGPDDDIIARINDTGDGIQIDNTLGTGFIQVESISGTTAADLNLEGRATTEGGSIDGSYEVQIEINTSDTLNEIMQAVNDAGIPINATVLNTGGGATPFRLVFTSEVTGSTGDLLVDDYGFGLNVTTLSEARDSKVFFGSEDPTLATLITRSSNTLSDVIQGVTIDLAQASADPVTLTITRDTTTIEEKVSEFVAAFNDAIGRIDDYDFFDVDSEERGPLLGNSTASQVRAALLRTVLGSADGVNTQYQFLSQVGITIGANSTLTFDRTRFQETLAADYDSVVNLFTAFEGATTTTQQIFPGVTVTINQQTFSQLGFADLFDQLLEGLTNSIDGTVTLADESIQSQIDLTQDRIDDFDERLDRRRAQMQREFTAMEVALAQLQAQQGALSSLFTNLALSQASLF